MKTSNKPTRTAAKVEAVDVKVIERFHPHSRANRIANLVVGACISEATRLDFDSATREDRDNAIADLKSNMSKAASQAAQRSGHKFTTEVGEFITRSGDLILTAVVTRLA